MPNTIITPVQPGVPGVIGGGPLYNVPGTATSVGPAPPTAFARPRIFYNGKVVDFPRAPWRWQAAPSPLRTVDVAEDGTTRTVLYNRLDIPVSGAFPIMDNAANLRASLHAWWQWALHGYGWQIMLDATKTVNTTLASVTSTTVFDVASPNGIIVGQVYKLLAGYLYQLVTVSAVSGTQITVTPELDTTFPVGTKFRDQNFYPAVIREQNPRCPIIDVDSGEAQTMPQTRFRLELEFFEDPN